MAGSARVRDKIGQDRQFEARGSGLSPLNSGKQVFATLRTVPAPDAVLSREAAIRDILLNNSATKKTPQKLGALFSWWAK
jgi:hypothetical protein